MGNSRFKKPKAPNMNSCFIAAAGLVVLIFPATSVAAQKCSAKLRGSWVTTEFNPGTVTIKLADIRPNKTFTLCHNLNLFLMSGAMRANQLFEFLERERSPT